MKDNKISNLEIFFTVSRYFDVKKLNESDLFINFRELKDEYNDIINYKFDKNGDSKQLALELNKLINKGIIIKDNDTLYINIDNNTAKDFNKTLDYDTHLKYFILIENYFNLNHIRDIKQMRLRKEITI